MAINGNRRGDCPTLQGQNGGFFRVPLAAAESAVG